MLAGVDQRGRFFSDRGADRIGALAFLGPGDTGRERDTVSLFQEIGIAQRMQDQAMDIGQDHHVVGIDDLLVQRFHDRRGVAVQHAVLFQQQGQVALAEGPEVGLGGAWDAVAGGALVGLFDHDVIGIGRKRAKGGWCSACRTCSIHCLRVHDGSPWGFFILAVSKCNTVQN